MAATNSAAATWNRQRAAWVVLCILLAGFAIVLLLNLRTPPQMGSDEGVFDTVDALFTAVTARDGRQLSACEGKLHAYKAAGKLPEASAQYLDGVIAGARRGGWESAARTLYEFMLAQRRDDFEAAPHREKKGKLAKDAKARS